MFVNMAVDESNTMMLMCAQAFFNMHNFTVQLSNSETQNAYREIIYMWDIPKD